MPPQQGKIPAFFIFFIFEQPIYLITLRQILPTFSSHDAEANKIAFAMCPDRRTKKKINITVDLDIGFRINCEMDERAASNIIWRIP